MEAGIGELVRMRRKKKRKREGSGCRYSAIFLSSTGGSISVRFDRLASPRCAALREGLLGAKPSSIEG